MPEPAPQVLPELLYAFTLLLPGLMPRVGLAGRHAQWAPAAAAAAPAAKSGAPAPAPPAEGGAAAEFFERPLSRAVFFLSFKQRAASLARQGSAGGSKRSLASSKSQLDASLVAEGDEEAPPPPAR